MVRSAVSGRQRERVKRRDEALTDLLDDRGQRVILG
jgi:hypothetical protein